MEFDFDIGKVLKDTITLVTGGQLEKWTAYRELQEIIDTVGAKSANAQRLSAPITLLSKLRTNSHRIYILTNKTNTAKATAVLGFIKVGTKQLFVLDHEGVHHQTHPLCVLDFYVHESHQRKEYGLKLFKHMLQAEHVHPSQLAVDRPSQKFKSFLRKHFHLWATIPQVNNFVVFEGFFRNNSNKKSRTCNKQNHYDEFRPLSRAFTEGALHQLNHKFQGDSFDGIRPASSTYSENDYYDTQSHVMSQHRNHRNNTFSRYSNTNMYVPSLPDKRRRSSQSRNDDEIVTNPYRESHNPKTKMFQQARILSSKNNEENDCARTSPTVVLDIKNITPENEDIIFNRDYTPDNSRAKAFQANDASQNDVEIDNNPNFMSNGDTPALKPRKELFEAKTGHNSLRYNYKNPADMLEELKKKDKELSSRRLTNREKYSFGSTSWNVFGIPSPSRFANR